MRVELGPLEELQLDENANDDDDDDDDGEIVDESESESESDGERESGSSTSTRVQRSRCALCLQRADGVNISYSCASASMLSRGAAQRRPEATAAQSQPIRRGLLRCTEEECPMRAHPACLAQFFLQHEPPSRLLPSTGMCPVCDQYLTWPELMRTFKVLRSACLYHHVHYDLVFGASAVYRLTELRHRSIVEQWLVGGDTIALWRASYLRFRRSALRASAITVLTYLPLAHRCAENTLKGSFAATNSLCSRAVANAAAARR